MPSEAAVDTLERLRGAIDNGALGEADRLLEDLVDTYASVRAEESALERKATAVRNRVEVLDGGIPDELTDFVTTSAATSMGRGGVLWGTRQYLLDPAEGGAEDLKGQIADLVEQEETFLEAETALRSTFDAVNVDLPAILVATGSELSDGPHTTDTVYDLTATARNVGDKPASSITLLVDAPDRVSVSPASADVGTLAPDGTVAREFTVEAGSPGEYNVNVVVESGDGNVDADSSTTQFTVLGPDGLSEQALEAVRLAKTRVKDSDLKKGRRQSLLSKLSSAETKVEQGRAQLERDNEKQADTQFRAATRILGAFLNALDGGGKPSRSLDDATRTALENLASTAIDQLSLAAEA